MAEITNIRPSFDVSPIVAGFIGATVLVVSASLTVFVWVCCHRRSEKAAKNPPYKFVHMLKGISIYPETLGSRKKAVPIRREKDRCPGSGGTAAAQLEGGSAGSPDREALGPRSAPFIDELHFTTDCEESPDTSSPKDSASSSDSKTPSPSSPELDVKLGSLTFSVGYNFPKKALVVMIQEAHGLPVMDESTQTSDPYIKMTILPEKKHRIKTRVLRKTLDPLFDETFTFYGIPYNQLQELVLHFLILSFDRYSRDDVIGEVMVPLAGVDPGSGKVQLTQQILKRSIQKCVSRGELLVSLSYQPVTHRLTVVVLKARHLPKMDIAGLSDPYVKVNVFYGRRRVAKKKTHVKKCTLNPVFNESFAFDIGAETLRDVSLELLVIDFDRMTKNEVVGCTVLGNSSSSSSGVQHWREICENPRRQVAKWHTLGEY
ncbi:synaptotagmin-11-like isoform X2 [Carcharodon carcharias]|uniref:synaptotagmin-11-like isoform X2 n=1 Tax=Carcharodon carcharias TaxID=13397 RepID=UPI001B7F2BF0|nr:synaptotagmin-11-like isoform X2 [Carcharodon carcharias]